MKCEVCPCRCAWAAPGCVPLRVLGPGRVQRELGGEKLDDDDDDDNDDDDKVRSWAARPLEYEIGYQNKWSQVGLYFHFKKNQKYLQHLKILG